MLVILWHTYYVVIADGGFMGLKPARHRTNVHSSIGSYHILVYLLVGMGTVLQTRVSSRVRDWRKLRDERSNGMGGVGGVTRMDGSSSSEMEPFSQEPAGASCRGLRLYSLCFDLSTWTDDRSKLGETRI